jgi:hypothetical protein
MTLESFWLVRREAHREPIRPNLQRGLEHLAESVFATRDLRVPNRDLTPQKLLNLTTKSER